MISVGESELYLYVTFHVADGVESEREVRLLQLAELLWHISLIPCKAIHARLFTNAPPGSLDAFGEPLRRRFELQSDLAVHHVDSRTLQHPYYLTWCHKEWLASDLKTAGQDSYFLYLEDDALFTASNLSYFAECNLQAREIGIIPSFLRSEWHSTMKRWVVVDALKAIGPLERAAISGQPVNGVYWVPMPNPYAGMYLLDFTLAQEYVKSASFDAVESAKMSNWGIRERAAMGMTFEGVHPSLRTRLAVGFTSTSRAPVIGSVIRHQGDKYSAMKGEFSTIPLFDLESKRKLGFTDISRRISGSMRRRPGTSE